jgi:hypothetical protein
MLVRNAEGSLTDNHKYQSVENLSIPAVCFALRNKWRISPRSQRPRDPAKRDHESG